VIPFCAYCGSVMVSLGSMRGATACLGGIEPTIGLQNSKLRTDVEERFDGTVS